MKCTWWIFPVTAMSLMASCFDDEKQEAFMEEEVSIDTVVITPPRSSITFILGKDEPGRNPYYTLANHYYRLNDSDRTEFVIDNLYTLLDVRNYLASHRPSNGKPWGVVNLVSHGNEFVDLGFYISRTGKRVSAESLRKAMSDGIIRPLDSTVLDEQTIFYVHGCSVGNNQPLLDALGLALGGKRPANVQASKLFEYYTNLEGNNPQSVRHYFAEVWYAFYRIDSGLVEDSLINQLQERYPEVNVDWKEALSREAPADPSEAYCMKILVPVIWEDFYKSPDQLPVLNTQRKQSRWVENNEEFLSLMEKTRIPREYFRIKFYRRIYERSDDTLYSNKAKAMAGVICIIRPLLERTISNDQYVPFRPSNSDACYFGFNE